MRLESIMQLMEQSGHWRKARVLRTKDCMANLSEADRLVRLARLGLKISRASYYLYLASAHAFVAGALSVKKTAKLPDADILKSSGACLIEVATSYIARLQSGPV
ncbi:hypothetical protein FHY18_000305 [Xanthomonas arboricola]|uniref:hypothetical protein n=1 Tax=Xanthomonas sp. 3793 TaxID=3035312 RepID=UPI0021687565|nr:hypothetical protein [Xanthomonas sp. 3793]MCS3744775.1 hypothetical protein [Xanthomonas sp. 3793]